MNTIKIENMEIGATADWKFGLITRNVLRVSENLFEINDTSDGWLTADVTLADMQGLMAGEIELDGLEWY